jgi:predicted nucleic acid-binding protein
MRCDFVVDNSVVMSWCFEDEVTPYTEAVLDALRYGRALVPALWAYEAANVLAVAVRRKRLTRPDAQRFAEALRRLPIEVDGAPDRATVAPLFAAATGSGLSAYDAAYLELAQRAKLPLATADAKLKRAAKAAGVAVFDPLRRSNA